MLGELNPCGGGDPIPLEKSPLLIGRRSKCDITLEFPNVSSHHCKLELKNGYWRVEDMNSTNGIKVNGDRCDAQWLMPGDVLHVAKHQFRIDYEPLGDRPPPSDPDIDVNPFEQGLLAKAGLARDSDVEASVRPAKRKRTERTKAPQPEETPASEPLRPPPPLDEDDDEMLEDAPSRLEFE